VTLEGRVALVTGAAKGIGRAIALTLATNGADIAVNYLSSQDEALEVVRGIESKGRKALAIRADVTSEVEVAVLVENTLAHFGRLDILVNNVGDWITKDVETMSLGEWRRVLDTSVTAAFLCSRQVLPIMKRQRWGRIVNLAAAGAYRAHGASGMSAFYAAKAGIVAFTKSLAREVGRSGITVNAVAPGVVADKERTVKEALEVKDEETSVGRPGTSWDIAATVTFLVSDEANFVTGDVINVTGGWLI
jgi:3-oxoacyl-[acyl-carrier protein] reductase